METDKEETKKRGRPKKSDSGKKKRVTKNQEYLIPLNKRTKEEQSAICTKGGVASGAARRRKKELREFMKDFLMQEANPALKANMKALGVDPEQMTNLAALCTRVFTKGVSQGDLNAARTAIEWAGMAPLQQERENEAIARMSQVMQLADGSAKEDDDETVVFYIPENGRPIITGDDIVSVSAEEGD